ncbi:MFS transporter [Nocardioides sp. NPDC051685]|uniref:MFS transporter n=1 Tax=Nocardioides sp. NPDC051685 TaxID=3364334 RepID=UPI0037BA3E2A
MTTPAPAETEAHAAAKAAHVPRRWRNLMTLTGISVVDNTEASAITTIFPSIATALNVSAAGLGALTALGKVASAPMGPAWVWLAGRIGRKETLMATTLLGGFFGVLAGLSPSFGWLLVFNTLMVASVIGGTPIVNAVIADSFEDKDRGKAAGVLYASINGAASFVGPAIATFTELGVDGWRYAMCTLGGICILAGAVVAVGFKDPGVGASEALLADLAEDQRVPTRVTFRSVLSLFRIPTYSVMMLSRLLSGHLLIPIFGVTFLVSERGFHNATAAIVLIPFGIGYVIGALGGGIGVSFVDRALPRTGRPLLLQTAQFAFAIFAFFGTQIPYSGGIAVYGVFWFLMAIAQGLNVPVNRPIVAAVILPELRAQGFAIWLTIFETIGWALFALVAGQLAAAIGIQTVFLWVVVGLMILNGLVLSALYVTYARDADRVNNELTRRRTQVTGII